MSKRKIIVITSIITAISIAAASFFAAAYFSLRSKTAAFSKLFAVDRMYEKDFIGDIDSEYLIDSILKGYVVGSGDKYGTYFTKEEFAEYNDTHSGKSAGIGILVIPANDGGRLRIVEVYKDSPAEKAGIRKNDVIISVEGADLRTVDHEEAAALIKGEIGSAVSFEILRSDEVLHYEINRDNYTINSVVAENIGGIGYIKIKQFIENLTFDEFKFAYDDLLSQGVSSIIFDVRDNPGGELNTVCNMLDILLPEGPIVRFSDKAGNFDRIDSDADCMDGIKAAVLINSSTYSAAELFASAMKDYEKATLIGNTTYGKGTMQYIIPFTDGTGIRMSARLYYPPFSDNFEGVGVVPDIDVDMDYSGIESYYDIDITNDTQILYALDYLSK